VFANAVSALQVLLAFVGALVTTPEPSMLAVVIAVAGILLTTLVILRGVPLRTASGGAHPRRARDVSAPLAQSDPDAAGHPRPRAPGRTLPAA